MGGIRLKFIEFSSALFTLMIFLAYSSDCTDCNPIVLIQQGTWMKSGNILESPLTPKSAGVMSQVNYTFDVQGPCEVSFKWGILAGSDYLELFCDGNLTPYVLDKTNDRMPWHPADSQVINYSIDNVGPHKLEICHGNNWGRGIARVYYICVKDLRLESFHPSFQPQSGVAIGESCNPSCVLNAFNYTLQIDAQPHSLDALIPREVKLYTRSPGSKETVSQGNGSYMGHGIFEWKKIKLISNQTGPSCYWFLITFPGETQPINSSEYDGPYIGPYLTNVVLNGDLDRSPINSSYYEDRYYINVQGLQPRLIYLYLYTNNTPYLFESQSYKPDESQNHPIMINRTFYRDNTPDAWGFGLI